MIENLKAAQTIVNRLLKCGSDINELVFFVRENCTEEEFDCFRSSMGKIMAEIYFEGLAPLYKSHPELIPDSDDSQTS
ncbi:MAG: hypothetical protein KDI90_05195 [Alphaproteobacteria bacterium]|nr:hypothetical protein [Alphaproteobacteria bacterium]